MVGRGIRKWRRCRTNYESLTSLDLLFTGILRASLTPDPGELAYGGAGVFCSHSATLDEKTRAYGYSLPMIQGYTIKVTDRTESGLFGLMDDHWISRRQPVS